MCILKLYCLISLSLVSYKCLDISSLEDITEPTCSDETCDNVTQVSTETYNQNTELTESSYTLGKEDDDESTEGLKLFTLKPQRPLLPVLPRKPNNTESILPNAKKPNIMISKKSEICECDLKVLIYYYINYLTLIF